MSVLADSSFSIDCSEQQNLDRDVVHTHQAASMPTDTATATPAKTLNNTTDRTCHELDNLTWLHNRPEREVYELLIDCFRLHRTRCLDESGGAGIEIATRDTLHQFLLKAEAILPDWWARKHASGCVLLSMKRGAMQWSQLNRLIYAKDIAEHYDCEDASTRVAELVALIYGTDHPQEAALAKLRWKA